MKVVLEKLSKYFGKVVAVNDLDLDMESGEFVALLGPSGCGKTTTLLMIAGIYKPTAGYIRFGDRVVNDLLPKDRKIGMVFQSYALYPHMNIFDNIAFPLTLQKTAKGEIKRRVAQVASLMRIEELLERKPGQLSGGQQQRAALARALVKEPDLLLLDEPLSNLDAKLRMAMRAEIKRLQKELGITTIFVTHDQVEAMTMADRIAVLDAGYLRQFSPPSELYDHPRNLFVAGFIGTPPMNLLPVHLEESDGCLMVRSEDWQAKLPAETARRLTPVIKGREVLLGIRPEDIAVGAVEEGTLPAEVYVTEPLGREILVDLRCGRDTIRALVAPPFAAPMGQAVGLRLDLSKAHLFDPQTEKSLLVS
ncbi:MAG: ABC transporter ATP-binding protein [Chloroflexota bacterium]